MCITAGILTYDRRYDRNRNSLLHLAFEVSVGLEHVGPSDHEQGIPRHCLKKYIIPRTNTAKTKIKQPDGQTAHRYSYVQQIKGQGILHMKLKKNKICNTDIP